MIFFIKVISYIGIVIIGNNNKEQKISLNILKEEIRPIF